jgi:ubiquinone/menaquinone biosynthesis C-methylase UbiE
MAVGDAALLAYYAQRASEYEKVYEKAERQADLARLHEIIPAFFVGRDVLEVACGTGYWTRRIAPRAHSVVATDLTVETMAVARANQPDWAHVRFERADAFALETVSGEFDAAFVGFLWSHIRHRDVPRFLTGLNRRLGAGALVVLVDNRYVEGSNYPITRTDDEGNTYQRRTLENGTVHEVLKNFPTSAALREKLVASGATDVSVVELQHYWLASYRDDTRRRRSRTPA